MWWLLCSRRCPVVPGPSLAGSVPALPQSFQAMGRRWLPPRVIGWALARPPMKLVRELAWRRWSAARGHNILSLRSFPGNQPFCFSPRHSAFLVLFSLFDLFPNIPPFSREIADHFALPGISQWRLSPAKGAAPVLRSLPPPQAPPRAIRSLARPYGQPRPHFHSNRNRGHAMMIVWWLTKGTANQGFGVFFPLILSCDMLNSVSILVVIQSVFFSRLLHPLKI